MLKKFMNYSKQLMKVKCPHSSCTQTIEFHEVKFDVINDKGEKIIECSSCGKTSKIICLNPSENESYIKSGAKEIRTIDYDVELPSDYLHATDIVVFTENFFDLNHSYDLNFLPLYKCKCGQCELEKLAYKAFEKNWNEHLCIEISKYYTIDIKGYGCNPENAVIKVNFLSDCGNEYSGIFYTNYTEFLEYDQFRLGSIPNAEPLVDRISRTFSKKDAMEILKKLIARWGLFYEKILIISPYIESSYARKGKIKDTLFSIIEQFPKNKDATIYTKTQTINVFKKAVSESFDIGYDFLENYELSLPAIDSSKKINNSHAKLYIGVSRDKAELLSGSANLAEGPSLEVLDFKNLRTDQLNDRYLNDHLKEPLSFTKATRDDVIFDENNSFKARCLEKAELYSFI